ncbi:MAG: cell envelope integrity EipB family protein [Mesorhizobium sp.]|nr:cell envelope integrity EipB family protein [Mesorhizobium sp.]MBL8579613.1 cell envelope integrity EipB family protein [Mesorhizobium sp.]
MRASRSIFVPSLTVSFLAIGVGIAGAVPLIQHRAVYDLNLEQASERSGITGISGRMVYELRGSACEGYTVRFRYVTQSSTTEASQMTDQQTTTFEDADGKTFSFATKSYTDQNLDKELRGNATRESAGVKIQIDKPETKSINLKPTQFPTQHLLDLIARAKSGETFYETSIFDGSEDADKAMTTTVVVGKQADASASDPEYKALKTLTTEKFWPVDIAYFDETSEGGEETPDYRISFKLYENGLTRDLDMDYGDFTIHGRLVDLAVFEPDDKTTCEK